MMTAEEVMTLMAAVIEIVTRYLPDPKDRAGIAEEMHALMNNGPETPVGAHSFGPNVPAGNTRP
jgi:hypothetical protein